MYSNKIQKRHAALSTCSASHAAGRVGCDATTCSGARQSAATLRARAATTARAERRRPLERGGARQTKVASTGARARGPGAGGGLQSPLLRVARDSPQPEPFVPVVELQKAR